MKIDLQKVLFLGPEGKKNEFLSAFQQAGNVQFIGTKVTFVDLLQSEFQDVVQAVKILQQFEVPQTPDVVIVDPLSFSRTLITDKQRMNDAKAELKTTLENISLIAPFGTIPHQLITSIEQETPLRFRLWMATKKRDAARLCPHLILISENTRHQYFLSLTPDPFTPPSGLETIPLSTEMATLDDKKTLLLH